MRKPSSAISSPTTTSNVFKNLFKGISEIDTNCGVTKLIVTFLATAALIASVLVRAPASPAADVASKESCSVTTSVLLDISGSGASADLVKRRVLATAKILDHIGSEGSCIVVDLIAGSQGQSKLIVRPTVLKGQGANDFLKKRDLKTKKLNMLVMVKDALESAPTDATAFYDGLRVGVEHCRSLAKKPKDCRLVALSDGINTTDPFNVLSLDLNDETILKIVDGLEKAGKTKGMRNVRLYVAGAGVTGDGEIEPERLSKIADLNALFAKRAGLILAQYDTELIAFP
jgi:hypothetical protein